MDTTKLGFDARLLMVGIAYRKRALPLAWSVHRGKMGWVTVKEHIALLRYVAELIPEGSEVWLLGDCEFQHVPLISWLREQGWRIFSIIGGWGVCGARTPTSPSLLR